MRRIADLLKRLGMFEYVERFAPKVALRVWSDGHRLGGWFMVERAHVDASIDQSRSIAAANRSAPAGNGKP